MSSVDAMMRSANPIPDPVVAFDLEEIDALLTVIEQRSAGTGGPGAGRAPRSPRGWMIATAAFAVAMILGALIVLTSVSGDETPPATTPPTTEATTTTTTMVEALEPPPGAISSGPLTIEAISEELGDFQWITIDIDDKRTLPFGRITYDPATGYRSDTQDGLTWVSRDGLEWTPESSADYDYFAERYERFELLGDYTRVDVTDDGGPPETLLFARDGADWVQVDLPVPSFPPTGMDLVVMYDRIRASGPSVLVTADVHGAVDWQTVFPDFQEFSLSAYQEDRLGIVLTGGDIVDLDVIARDTELVFEDASSGAVVLTLQVPTAARAAGIAADPTCFVFSTCALGSAAWMSIDGGVFEEIEIAGDFEAIEVQGTRREVVVVSTGEFAYLHPETGELLLTSDGVDWTPSGVTFDGIPACADQGGLDYLNLDHQDGSYFISFACNASESTAEEWRSHDGLEWSPGGATPPSAGFQVMVSAEDPDRPVPLISIDGGATWVELPLPPGHSSVEGFTEAGEGPAVAAGDLVFYFFSREDDYWMAVGQFLGSEGTS